MTTQASGTAEGGELITQAEAAERRLAETNPAPPALPADARDDGPLMAAIQRAACDPNFDVEKLRALREIQRDWDAEQAKKAYDDALSRAQAAMPIVEKNKHTHFGEGDKEVDYWYADYGALVDAVKPALTAEGFSFDHKIVQEIVGEGQRITVTCFLKRAGHSESVTMFAPPEGSPGMNVIQKIKSTTTSLKRATLEAITGAATEDGDDDGRGAGAEEEKLSLSEVAFLNAELEALNADRARFLNHLGVEALEDLPSSRFNEAKVALEAKRQAMERQQGDDSGPPAAAEGATDPNADNPLMGG